MKKNGENELKQILLISEQRMNKLLQFYKNIEELNKKYEYYNQNIIFILITLREIEIIKDKLQKKEMNKIRIPAFNLKLKKIFQFEFEDIDLTDCTQIWEYLYEDDAGEGLYYAGNTEEHGSNIYCLGSGDARPLKDFVIEMKEITYRLYADESVSEGKYYSNFYGGALVNVSDINKIEKILSKENK